MRHRTIILVNILYFDCIITTIIAMVYYNYQISHPHSSSSSRSTTDYYSTTTTTTTITATTILSISHTSLHYT